MIQHVRHIAHPRGNMNDPAWAAEFKAFNKRPLTTVTDDELLRYWRPEMIYVNCDESGKAYGR